MLHVNVKNLRDTHKKTKAGAKALELQLTCFVVFMERNLPPLKWRITFDAVKVVCLVISHVYFTFFLHTHLQNETRDLSCPVTVTDRRIVSC